MSPLARKTKQGVIGLGLCALWGSCLISLAVAGLMDPRLTLVLAVFPIFIFIGWVFFNFLGFWSGWSLVLLWPATTMYIDNPIIESLGSLRLFVANVLIVWWLVFTVSRYRSSGMSGLFGDAWL